MNRFLALATSASLLLAGLGAVGPDQAFAAPAAAPASTPCAAGTPVTGDYNGDGSADLAVSVDSNEFDDSRLFVSLNRSATGTWLDIKGERIRSADLNGDVCADAIVTQVAGEDVILVLGAASGLVAASATTVELPQSDGPGFIHAKAIDLHHDGMIQLVVVGCLFTYGVSFAAFADVYTLDAAGAPGTPQVIDLSSLDVESAPTALAADDGILVAGFADERVTGLYGAGGVHVLTPDTAVPQKLVLRARISQASAGIAGAPEKNGHFGHSLALRDGHLAIGAPRATVGTTRRTGRVQLMTWDATNSAFTPARAIDQNTKGVVGTNETGDQFGNSVAIAKGLTAASSYDVVIGAPGEAVGKASRAGAFTVASLTSSTSYTYTQNSAGMPGTSEKGDAFGFSLGVLPTSADTDTLAVGAPQEAGNECYPENQGYVVIGDGGRLRSSTRWTRLTSHCGQYDAVYFAAWGRGFGN